MSKDVATTILNQLGGNRFLAMTGARNLVAGNACLSMHLPRGLAKSKIDRVTVKLEESDTYCVTFGRWNARALAITEIETVSGVYCDNLRRVFTDATGLDTHL